MSEPLLAPMRTWLAAPMDHDVSEAIERLRRAPDVQQVAVMPDVHLSSDVCIGITIATSHLIYPQAVGGDIGCGMLAVGLDVDAAVFRNPKLAGQVLAELSVTVPARRRNRRATVVQPDDLWKDTLSIPDWIHSAGMKACLSSQHLAAEITSSRFRQMRTIASG